MSQGGGLALMKAPGTNGGGSGLHGIFQVWEDAHARAAGQGQD